MNEIGCQNHPLISSYLIHRKIIGITGMLMPFIVWLGERIFYDIKMLSSISAYYHTHMTSIFSGTLCLIGFFLFTYRGYDKVDNYTCSIASMGAIGIGLIPTEIPKHPDINLTVSFGLPEWESVHLLSVALFFGALIYMVGFRFTKSPNSKYVPYIRIRRRKIYKAMAWGMVIAGLLLVAYYLTKELIVSDELKIVLESMNPIFYIEVLAIECFGIAWLLKGVDLRKAMSIPQKPTSLRPQQ